MKKRIIYMEKLRVLCMLLVVYAHCCGAVFSQYTDSALQSYQAVVIYTIRYMCSSVVPIFFMITGALFLNPSYELRLDKLLKKYVLKYFLVACLFGWAYSLMDMIYETRFASFSLTILWDSFLNMLQGQSAHHMWYMYDIVGFMLILPVLKAIANSCDKRTQKYLGIVFFVFLVCIPTLNSVLNIQIGFNLPFKNVYLLYMLVGYWLSEKVQYNKSEVLTIGIIIILGVLCINAYESYRFMFQNLHPIWNERSSLVCFFRTLAIFMVFKVFLNKEDKIYTICQFLSPYSFGVYLIHVFWIHILIKIIQFNPFEGISVFRIIFLWLVAVALSVVSCMAMKKIPLLKNLL